MKTKILNDLKNKLLEDLALRSSALLSALSVVTAGVFISRDFGNF
jgi:hypothetical protein